jgi:hypothetical protein
MTRYLAICLLFAPVSIFGNDQFWPMYLARGEFYNKQLLHIEYQPRINEEFTKTDAIMHRLAYGYQIFEKHSFWIGYAHLVTREPSAFFENRGFLQWLHQDKFKKLKITQHVRVEERNFSRFAKLKQRSRYKLRLQYPIYEKFKIYGVLQNEIFYNLNTISSNNKAGFEQNRFAPGININFDNKTQIEFVITRTNRFIENEISESRNFYVLRYAYFF